MNKIPDRPDPNAAFPNPKIPSLCFIKNVVKNPRIIIGDFTYYDDPNGADQFEKQVTHFYDFIGDKLIIGKFRAIAPVKDELPLKGDTVVASDIPPYAVAAGNPCRVIKKRFDEDLIAYLLDLKWWDWDIEKIEANFEALSSGDLTLIKKIGR